ncbi:MAG: ATP-dependent DNA helicase [Pseudomonadota bacterium]
MSVDQVAQAFAAGGALAQTVENYAPREEQREMALAVADAMASGENLVVEAGTGTGKTFAYLVPALLSGKRVAISTGTRALQDQLFSRDLPTVARAIGVPVEVAMLKGRSNYLCRHRLPQAVDRGAEGAALARIREWGWRTRTGDIAEVEDVPEESPIWAQVTSTADNCLGSRCGKFSDCHVAQARRRAGGAGVVIVNHHLLLADLALRDGGFGELLPDIDVVVVDEAHQLPQIAAQQFGRSFGSAQLVAWVGDFTDEVTRTANATPRLASLRKDLENRAAGVRSALGQETRRLAWDDLGERATAPLNQALDEMAEHLTTLALALEELADDEPSSDHLARRARQLGSFLQDFLAAGDASAQAVTDPADALLRWVDVHRHHFSLHLTPVEAATALGASLQARRCAWVMTSATLAVEKDFRHYLERIGLDAQTKTLQLTSPFDYQRNCQVYLPDGLPDPSSTGYVQQACAAALPLLAANPGGSFALFTSHRALEAARRWLDGRLDRLLLVQGDAPRSILLERFRADGRAVLLGTNSFWEGVDVRGPALSLVVIDKLPFASPGEPLLKARLDWLKEQGRSGFRDHLLPNAVIALKQGVGRLIRDHEDRGVLMLCDPRLRTRGYGKRFLRSLPTMTTTSEAQEAMAFLCGVASTSVESLPEASS